MNRIFENYFTTNPAEGGPMTQKLPNTCHVDDLPKLPAAAKACSECPWRKSNADREHPGGMYSDDVFTRSWRGIALDGNFFGCHLFDAGFYPVSEEAEEMGYKMPADIGARRECAGLLAVIREELKHFASYDSHEAYIAARPVGLSKGVLLRIKQRLEGIVEPALRFSPNATDIADPMERVDQNSLEWTFGREGQVAMKLNLDALIGDSCDCPLCAGHTSVHPSKDLVLDGGEIVPVDEELHELLMAMNAVGIRTTDSCVDVADALDKLYPDRKTALLRAPAGKVNYRSMILRQAAHIRFNNTSLAARAFRETAAKTPGIEVTTSGLMTQLVFDPSSTPVLTTYAKGLKTILSKTKSAEENA